MPVHQTTTIWIDHKTKTDVRIVCGLCSAWNCRYCHNQQELLHISGGMKMMDVDRAGWFLKLTPKSDSPSITCRHNCQSGCFNESNILLKTTSQRRPPVPLTVIYVPNKMIFVQDLSKEVEIHWAGRRSIMKVCSGLCLMISRTNSFSNVSSSLNDFAMFH